MAKKRITARVQRLRRRCLDCGARGTWERTQRGTFALKVGGTWHWWNCPKQWRLREGYAEQRKRERAFKAAMERET